MEKQNLGNKIQSNLFSCSFVISLVSLAHRKPHAEASYWYLALQTRVPPRVKRPCKTPQLWAWAEALLHTPPQFKMAAGRGQRRCSGPALWSLSGMAVPALGEPRPAPTHPAEEIL